MVGLNVKLKFEKFLKPCESLKNLNTSVCSISTGTLYITHNGFRSSITKLDFNDDYFATDFKIFLKLKVARRAD